MSRPPQFRLNSPRVKLSENDVRKACLDLLRVNHWWPIRQHVGRFQTIDHRWISVGEAGDPDYVIVKPPSFFLETKKPGGELSDEQRTKIFQLEKFYGLETVVVEGVEELMDWLDRHQRSP